MEPVSGGVCGVEDVHLAAAAPHAPLLNLPTSSQLRSSQHINVTSLSVGVEMPVVLDRLPLPSLTWYTGLSVLLLSCSVYYAGVQVALNPNWKQKLLEKSNVSGVGEEGEVSLYHTSEPDGLSQERQMTPYLIPEVISFMFHEPLCIWVRWPPHKFINVNMKSVRLKLGNMTI